MLMLISLLLQSWKFWCYRFLSSLMLLHDVIMTSYCCQRHAECLVTTLFQQDSAPAYHAVQCNSWTVASRNAKLSWIQPVASKQPRSQSCGWWDLDCHTASCLPQTNSYCGWSETAAHRCLVQSWIIDFWRGYWPVVRKTCSACLCWRRTFRVQPVIWQCWFCPYLLHSVLLVWLLHL